jgi:hypothetical protein
MPHTGNAVKQFVVRYIAIVWDLHAYKVVVESITNAHTACKKPKMGIPAGKGLTFISTRWKELSAHSDIVSHTNPDVHWIE